VTLMALHSVDPTHIIVRSFFPAALIAALVLGVANSVVKPILQYAVEAMTCLLSCLTLGLWSIIVSLFLNGFLFWLCGQLLKPGFQVIGPWPALWGALALSCVNALVTILMRKEEEK
jgi:putative membrane protein